MARQATGGVVPPKGQRRSWAIRFRAYGKRHTITLGRPEDGWNRRRAEDELAVVMADVRRGVWRPPAPDAKPRHAEPEPTFGKFCEEWLEGVSPEWRERTLVDCRWRLDRHLLPFFAEHRLSEITVREVDQYRHLKVRESKSLQEARRRQLAQPDDKHRPLPRPLSNGSINKTIRLLATILEQAVEYGYLVRNPAKGRKRFLREPKPVRTYLQPEQLAALLRAAAEMDAAASEGDSGRRQPLLAVLALAGLRISEALGLRWRDVDLTSRKLRVVQAKTHAGIRHVHLTPTLQKLLADYRVRTEHRGADDLVFATERGRRDNPSNVRNRFLAPAVKHANEKLRQTGREEMGAVTPHSLRRTFISLLLAAGADVPYVMAQAGHADPKMTLGVYAHVIALKTDHGAALDGLVNSSDWAQTGAEKSQKQDSEALPHQL